MACCGKARRRCRALLPFFAALRSTRRAFVLATNNAGLTIDQYVARLGKHGVEVSSAEVMNSAEATADWLMARAPSARLNVIGGPGLLDALTRRGFHIVDSGVDFVVVGKDYGLTWQKLDAAVLAIGTGAQLVGTNPDVTYPIENGLGIGNGAILAALTAATGVSPIIIGKPERLCINKRWRACNARRQARWRLATGWIPTFWARNALASRVCCC
ncbi:hypothetical protein EMGBS3_04380 [Anaerolineaceae bacterium]|nr:hypothetical protein EMGBS3_04380 [Anaerolineaceae bacterium]